MIFSTLQQHYNSKLPRYFQSNFRSVQASAPHKAVLQMWHITDFFLKFTSNLPVTTLTFFLNTYFVLWERRGVTLESLPRARYWYASCFSWQSVRLLNRCAGDPTHPPRRWRQYVPLEHRHTFDSSDNTTYHGCVMSELWQRTFSANK